MIPPRNTVNSVERIPRRDAPDFEESESGMIGSISEAVSYTHLTLPTKA